MPKVLEKASGWRWPARAIPYHERYLRHVTDMDAGIGHCKTRRSVIQAGGHIGLWPDRLSRFFERVYTFEPEFENFQALVVNVQRKNVFKFNCGLGDAPERLTLNVHRKNIGGHHVEVKGSRTVPSADDPANKNHRNERLEIPIITIDSLGVTDVDMIILDIEGSELAALRGAMETIGHSQPVIMIEDRGHEVNYGRAAEGELHRWFATMGYEQVGKECRDTIWGPKK